MTRRGANYLRPRFAVLCKSVKFGMVRVIHHNNVWGVYVSREVGERHHNPHAHIQLRGTRVATVFLVTLHYEFGVDEVPKALKRKVADHQDELIAKWEELNEG